jgi:drug/metabolite transporter (DMT)-like permease
MTHEAARLRLKTRLFAPVVVLSGVLGNYFMKLGMPGTLAFPLDYITVLFRPYVALGVLLLILWLLTRMALLSWADLSYVVPVTSVGYALTALAGQVFLHEAISLKHWTGIGLIVAGVSLVSGGTEARTFPAHAEETRR